jgi:8-oxo-dGTP pyrophosphatase MutT (NUDIX family)
MSHPVTLNDIRRAVGRPPKVLDYPDQPMAAVAAVLTGDLQLLFIKRADYPGDPWSGHISFPGGRVEDDDPSPRHAALRETQEELSLDLTDAEFIGRLDDLPTLGGLPPMVIRPFVFTIPTLPALRPNGEVASTHLLSLETLLSDLGRRPFQFAHRDSDYTLPCVEFGGHRLWGLTLLFVDDLLHRLDGRGRGLERIETQERTPR